MPVVPTSMLEHFGQAHSFTVKIGYGRSAPVPSLELDDILRAAPVLPTCRRACQGVAQRADLPQRRRSRGGCPR